MSIQDKFKVNQAVVTPIGEGVFQGAKNETAGLVRVKVDETTTAHLLDENCLTPHASQSGLWLFEEVELR